MPEKILLNIIKLFNIPEENIKMLPEHDGGRNRIYCCAKGMLIAGHGLYGFSDR